MDDYAPAFAGLPRLRGAAAAAFFAGAAALLRNCPSPERFANSDR
jgi:hypothetical protein